MTFIGYDPEASPAFTFFYPEFDQDRGVPLHDHRDNFNGGFAFAVFHPGTSLPQMPWAI